MAHPHRVDPVRPRPTPTRTASPPPRIARRFPPLVDSAWRAPWVEGSVGAVMSGVVGSGIADARVGECGGGDGGPVWERAVDGPGPSGFLEVSGRGGRKPSNTSFSGFRTECYRSVS